MSNIFKVCSLFIVILSLTLTAYAQSEIVYSTLTYNGKNLDKLIIGRIPEYGLGAKDGCIIEPQMKLSFKDIDAKCVEGMLKETVYDIPLHNADIFLIKAKRVVDTLHTDSLGCFILQKTASFDQLNIQRRSFRDITIKRSRKYLF